MTWSEAIVYGEVAVAEVTELLEVLRDLQTAGLHLKVHGGAEPGSSAIITLDQQMGVVIQRGHLDVRNAALLRDWLERQVDDRDLWAKYMTRVALHRRPTLLEVARAALCVAKEAGS